MCDTVTLKTNIAACVLIEEKRRTTSGFSDDIFVLAASDLSYTAQRRTEFWMDYDARLYWCVIIVTHLLATFHQDQSFVTPAATDGT